MASILNDHRPPTADRYYGGRWSAVSRRLLLWLGWLFTGLALIQLALVNNDLSPTAFLPLLVLILCGGVSAYFLASRSRPGDPLLLPLI
ncbi:MAG TPA: hypothetical protein VEC96_05105, partial [Anaerolineae bacterium]|nr:hypothetical protein [Anaerolineae bacterium]